MSDHNPHEIFLHQIANLNFGNPTKAKAEFIQHVNAFLDQNKMPVVVKDAIIQRCEKTCDLSLTDVYSASAILHQCFTDTLIDTYRHIQQVPISNLLTEDMLNQLYQVDMTKASAPYHIYAIVQDLPSLNAHGLDLGSHLNILDWSRYQNHTAAAVLQVWIYQTAQYGLDQARKDQADIELVLAEFNQPQPKPNVTLDEPNVTLVDEVD